MFPFEMARGMLLLIGLFLILLGLLNPIILSRRFGSYAGSTRAFVADMILSLVAILAGVLLILRSGILVVSDWIVILTQVALWTIVILLFPFSVRFGRWSRWNKRQ